MCSKCPPSARADPARSGRPENVALRLYFGSSTTDVFRTFGQRYQRTFSGVTFVERPRERRGNVQLRRLPERSQKTSFKRYEYVQSTETFRPNCTPYNVEYEIFICHFSSILEFTDTKVVYDPTVPTRAVHT